MDSTVEYSNLLAKDANELASSLTFWHAQGWRPVGSPFVDGSFIALLIVKNTQTGCSHLKGLTPGLRCVECGEERPGVIQIGG